MVKENHLQTFIGKFLYGSLFIVLLPLFLVAWSLSLDKSTNFPEPQLPLLAVVSFLFGTFLVVKGILNLLTYGKGLPMNAYPPKKFVTQEVYSWFSHPIYLGAALLSFSISLGLRSSSGLYIVTPIFILAMISFVYGYERLAIKKLFGNATNNYNPLFAIPVSSVKSVDWSKKIAMFIRISLPWLIAGYLVDYGRCSQKCPGAFMSLIDTQQLLNLFNLIWLIPFIYIALKLFISKTRKELRQICIVGTIAILLHIYLYALLPAFNFDVTSSGWKTILISTAVVFLAINYLYIWRILQNITEWVANSRHDWLFVHGNFRIINHSIYSGLAGAIGVGIASLIMGNNLAAIILAICVIVGATVFAQLLWGSNALLRPFGYWGAILGGLVGIFTVYIIFGIPLAKIFLAGVLCAPFAQAIGRLRCLAQGCCHGTGTSQELGIRVWQNQSRVVVLSGLKGQYILNTQLYSILFNLLLGFLLFGLWTSRNYSSSITIGTYLILTALERFTEDAYRGEKQTRMLWGLRENQWIAITALIIGIFITMIPVTLPLASVNTFNIPFLITSIFGGLIVAFAMSMDFPRACLRFSHLSG